MARRGTRRVLTANSLLPERLVSRGAKRVSAPGDRRFPYHRQTAHRRDGTVDTFIGNTQLIQCQTVDSRQKTGTNQQYRTTRFREIWRDIANLMTDQ